MRTTLMLLLICLLFISTYVIIQNHQLRKERDSLTEKLRMCNETIDIINSFECGERDSVLVNVTEARVIRTGKLTGKDKQP